MTARADFEAAVHGALTKHRHALADGTWQRTADNALVDEVLNAWDKSITNLVRPQRPPSGLIRNPEAQAARIRAQLAHGDDPETQAERRLALEAYAMRKTAL